MPWSTVRSAIQGAVDAQILERTEDSGDWPCDYDHAREVRLRAPTTEPHPKPRPKPPQFRVAEADLSVAQVQDLADAIGEIAAAAAGRELKLHMRVEFEPGQEGAAELVERLNRLLEGISADLRLQ